MRLRTLPDDVRYTIPVDAVCFDPWSPLWPSLSTRSGDSLERGQIAGIERDAVVLRYQAELMGMGKRKAERQAVSLPAAPRPPPQDPSTAIH